MIPFLNLKKQNLSIQKKIDKAIKNVVNESAFISGKYVEKFEKEFATFQQSKYCIGVANGTDALEIAIESLNFPPQSEIIVPANSFIASAESVTRAGHKVVFCDCNSNNYTISLESLKQKITKNTRAIITVHLYGHPCEMDEIKKIAKQKKLKIIEDCAQSHGAEYNGKRIGSIGDIGCFSFYPGKNLGAFGDGGAITTNNVTLAKKCRMIANHGRISKYDHQFEGRNSRLDGLHAAILSVKLQSLEKWTRQRIKIANYYLKNLKDLEEIVLPIRNKNVRQVYHLFVIRTKKRNALKKFLQENKISTGIHYPIALPKLKAYDYLQQKKENFFANKNDKNLLSLPIGEHLTEKDISFVVKKIKQFFNK